MKLIVFTVCLCLAAFAAGFSDEVKATIMQHRAECLESVEVSEELVDNAHKNGDFADDDQLKEFYFCFLHKLEFLNDDGEYQVDVIREKMSSEFGEDLTEQIIECASEDHHNGPENAIQLSKCVHEIVPKEHFQE